MLKKKKKKVILTCCQVIVRQCEDVIISDIDKNLQGPKMYLCANFGCSTPDCVGGVRGQRNTETDL